MEIEPRRLAVRPLPGHAAAGARLGLRQRAAGSDLDLPEADRGRVRGRRRDPRLRRRDRHPRVRTLLRHERGRDRGDRREVLAWRVAGRRERCESQRPRNASASTSSRPRGPTRSSRPSRPRPDDRFVEIGPGPGRADAAAGAAGRAPDGHRDRSRRWSRCCAPQRAARTSTLVAGDFLDVDLALARGRAARCASPATFPTTSRRRSSSSCSARTGESAAIVDATLMLQREVAERIAGRRRAAATTACCPSSCSSMPTSGRVLTLPPGRVPAGAEGPLGGRPVSPSGRPPSPLADERVVRSDGPDDVHAAAEDAAERAARRSPSRRDRIAGAALAAAGIDGRRRPETLQLTELARLAEFFCARLTPELCYSLRVFAQSLVRRPSGAPGGHSDGGSQPLRVRFRPPRAALRAPGPSTADTA